jgi:hypothetical protein
LPARTAFNKIYEIAVLLAFRNPARQVMDTKPRRRPGLLIFSLVFLAVAGAIAATVLLANDKHNLNRLLQAFGLPSVETKAPPPRPGVVDKFRGKRLTGVPLPLEVSSFDPAEVEKSGALLRNLHKDGETLCELFNRIGFTMSSWKPGSFAKNINECYSELTIPNPADADNPSSFFLMIKGGADGTLISARVKFIFNDAASRAKVTDMAVKVLSEYAAATTWDEIAQASDKVRALKPFVLVQSGVSVRFFSEFSAAGRYNLVLSRTPKLSRSERRSEAYFDRSNFLPLTPEFGGPPIVGEPDAVKDEKAGEEKAKTEAAKPAQAQP